MNFYADFATTANITLSGLQTVDGVAARDGMLALVKDQSDDTENKLYRVRTGAWEPISEFNSLRDVTGALVRVKTGTVSAGLTYICSSGVGAGAPMSFVELSGALDVLSALSRITSDADFNGQNITNVGTVDGRDVSADGAILDDVDVGAPAISRILMATQPTDEDTITIGSNTYEFVDTGVDDDVSNDAYIAVDIGADAAAARTNLVAAINATDPDGAHDSLFQTDSTTPALANGTENVTAAAAGDAVFIHPASAPGDSAYQPEAPDLALSASLTTGEDWDIANLNAGWGYEPGSRKYLKAEVNITTAIIALGNATILAPDGMTVTHAAVLAAHNSSGVPLDNIGTDSIAVSGGVSAVLTLNGGGGDLANGDVVTVMLWGT